MLRPGGFAGPGFEDQGETAYSDGSDLDIVDAVADRVMACNADRTRFRQAGSPSQCAAKQRPLPGWETPAVGSRCADENSK